MFRFLTIIMLLVMLSACQVLGGDSDGDDGGSPNAAIQWDRSPDTVVFRADVTGGEFEDMFFAHNEIPFCTIFGDNRIVWTVDTGYSNAQILIDRLTDGQVRGFVSTLTIDDRIYTFEAEANLEPPTTVAPVVETLALFVNGVNHQTDSFSNWPPDYFQDVLELCRTMPSAPVEYVPDAAWVSAQATTYDGGIPSILWDAEASGLSLKELADSGEQRWVDDNNVKILWDVIRRTGIDTQFSEGDGTYYVVVEVPDISPGAPPAPSD